MRVSRIVLNGISIMAVEKQGMKNGMYWVPRP
jgi:hypothetical protein